VFISKVGLTSLDLGFHLMSAWHPMGSFKVFTEELLAKKQLQHDEP
jgi:hypothetical protein